MNEKLVIIMPVYNECEIIAEVVEKWVNEFCKNKIDYTFYIYNDGSKDNTAQILDEICKSNAKVKHINKLNEGHGPSILRGYKSVANDPSVTWIFQIDSDDELPSEMFGALWDKREEYDFLLGRRDGRSQPIARKIVSLASRLTVDLFYGHSVWDVNSPYRLMRRSAFAELLVTIPDQTFAPNVIISGLVALKKLKFLEIDVPYTPRRTGEVSLNKLKLLKSSIKSFAQTILYRYK